MKKAKKGVKYFTDDTEKWIVEYNSSTDPVYRAEIFTKHIYYPFYKLVENIIHRFKFYYTDVDNLEDLKHEVVTVLLEDKIMKFDASYGAKAYSYFGTIVKRWLINYNAQNYKKLTTNSSITHYDIVEDNPKVYTDLNMMNLGSVMDRWVNDCNERLTEMFTKDSDLRIAEAVLTLFDKRDVIEVFRKKALYIYIREMTNCETANITSVISVMKSDFLKYKERYSSEYEVVSI
jgi:hypothetical protein